MLKFNAIYTIYSVCYFDWSFYEAILWLHYGCVHLKSFMFVTQVYFVNVVDNLNNTHSTMKRNPDIINYS